MALAVQAPQQFKQPSRKGKRAWRKNVDISDVQEGLEIVREEVIQGGVISEKPSSDLFTLDISGSSTIATTYRARKPLRVDEILAKRSAVPAIDSRKRKTTDGVIEPATKKRKGVSHEELERLKHIAYGGDAVHKAVVQAHDGANYDPWAAAILPQNPEFSYLPKSKPIREPRTLKEASISLLASGKRVPAVAKPVAGNSYNPAFTDWNAVVTAAGEEEVKAERARLEAARLEAERLEKALAAAAESDREVADGEESAWESEWEGIESEPEAEWLRAKRPERKTPAARNKIKRRKEEERRTAWEAKMKVKEEQARRIKRLAKAVEEEERARAKALEAVSSDGSEEDDNMVLRRRKLGKAPIPDAPLEIVLANELQDSLRLLKPEGNLLNDRFRSMLLRGKIESRRPTTQPKKPRREVMTKWSYKDWKLR